MNRASGALAAGSVAGLVTLVALGVLALEPPWADAAARAPLTAPPGPVADPAPGPTAPATAGVAPAGAEGPVPPVGQAPGAQAPVGPVTTGGPAAAADPAWVAQTATVAGVPARALAAYASAELVVAGEQPGCHLPWTALAGVGWVESHHGTIDGRAVADDGRPRWRDDPDAAAGPAAIVGVALTGRRTASIADSDDGVLDGDTRWDRAVGPMQFIPGTWRAWGADGDGDGAADPQDLDDAALAAARYLCASGADLRDPGAWGRAVLSYNRSAAYAADVTSAANTYAARGRD